MRIRFLLRSLIIPVALAAAACSPSIVAGPEPITDPALATYAARLGIDIATFTKTSSGLYVKDVPAGWGSVPADTGDTVTVDYTGYLTDGRIFDASRANGGTPVNFIVGVSQLVAGFQEGLVGLRVGGKRRLILPPSLAYGRVGTASVPPNAILIFDITVHGVR